MKKFRIAVFYTEETVEWWNDIEAETAEEAKEKVLYHGLDPSGSEILDGERIRIEEWDEQGNMIQELKLN